VTYVSGLFTLELDFNDPNPTLAWAECDVDLMGQPIVRFHCVCADGTGADTYGWYDYLFLRANYVAGCLDLVIDIDGEWSVEDSFEIIDIADDLLDAQEGEADPQSLLSRLLAAAGSKVRVRSATEDDISRIEGLPLIAERGIREELSQRGRWDPPGQDAPRE
jgi:hypothetical protein